MLIKVGCGGVSLERLHPALQKVIKIVSEVWDKEEVVITSTWESNHLDFSWHYFCRALDFRPPRLYTVKKIQKLRERLKNNYDVVYEGNHIHIEYDPKESE